MLYDLVSVALYRAFDQGPGKLVVCSSSSSLWPPTDPYSLTTAAGGHTHGFREVMQLHFFNHTMVDVVTTPHLMERGAVFTQIWALKHPDICDLVEHYFREKVGSIDSRPLSLFRD
jgi:hypothetical protein